MSALFRVLPVAAGVVLLVADPAALLAQVQRAVRSSDVITRDEIERARVDDAYQAVLRLRPEFLQRSGHPRARVRSPGSEPTAGHRRGSDPDASALDTERSGRSTGAGADGPVGFAGAGPSVERSPGTATPVEQSPDTLLVYVGDAVAGGFEELATIPAADVQEIRWLRPADAQYRFGMRHSGAVILVTLQH
jgi:hypothetical protein